MLRLLHVLTYLELNVCLISSFEALYAVIIFYMNQELSAGIYRKHDQYHTSVNFKSHWCQKSFKIQQPFLINFTNSLILYKKRIVLYEKKQQQINKQHEWILEKSESRTRNLLHSTHTLYHLTISDVTIYHLNVIDEQVNVYSSGTNF